ncbi:PAS domain S-box protein [bacterium]|nr:PAS domain S-box protein [bacterium]
MSLYTVISGIVVGLLILSSVFSGFLALRNIERRVNLWYTLFACCLTITTILGTLLVYEADPATALLYDRFVNMFLLLTGGAFVSLVSALTGYETRAAIISMLAMLLFLLIANWLLPYGLTWSSVHGMIVEEYFWGEKLQGIDGSTGVGNYFSMAAVIALLLYTVRAVIYQMQHGEKEYARLLLAAITVGLLGLFLDVVLLDIRNVELGLVDDIGILCFILLVGHRNLYHLVRSNDLLRESEARFSMLTDAAFEGIVFTERGIILDVNRQLAGILGCTVEEMIGREVIEFVAPGSREVVKSNIESEDESRYEHHARKKDGSLFPVEVRVKNMLHNGRKVRVTAIRDVTDRKRTEEQNILLAQTLKSVRDCISITDNEDHIIFVNDAFLATYGFTENEVLGQHVSVLRPANLAPEKTQGIFPSTREGGWHGEVLNQRKDGTEFPVELWTSVVRDQEGKPVAYVGVARDISDRKFAEQAIIAEKERAERSDRLKDAFIANISHEVRTPLNIILGYTGLIGEMMQGKIDDEEQGYYDSVQRGAQRLQRTVDMILSISRLQVGDVRLEPKDIDLKQLLEDIIEDYHPLAKEKGLTLAFTSELASPIVRTDEYCTVQTVQNLIDNAIKYTRKGGVTLRLCSTPSGKPRIEVVDTGIGISQEYLPLLFEPYTQEESGYTRSFEGIGLGMSLVKKYTELLGASLDISSEKNRGTTISITFGAKTDSALLPGDEGSEEDEGQHEEGIRVLLVEDERLTIEYMSTLLRGHVHLCFAESASEAWDVLRTEKVDLVFMDISLAGEKSGLDITREIRADARLARLPIVAVTAHGFAHDRTRCIEAGCDAYLLKPVGQDDLLDTIRALLPDALKK